MNNMVPPFTNILVHVNPRLERDAAAKCAVSLAKQWNSALTLYDVTADLSWPLQYLMGGWEEMVEQVSGSKRRALNELTQQVRDEGVEASGELGDGRLSQAISKRVLAADHDLVIKVAGGGGPDRSGFLSSTDQRLLRDCPCALLILSPAGGAGFKRVAAAVDVMDTHEIQTKLDEAVLLAGRELCHGDLDLLYAMPSLRTIIDVDRTDTDLVDEGRVAKWDADLRRVAREKLEALSADARFAPATAHVLAGDPEEVVPAFAREQGVDLLVMGTLGRSGLDGMLIGNTAERLLANVECSVLALKPQTYCVSNADEKLEDIRSSN